MGKSLVSECLLAVTIGWGGVSLQAAPSRPVPPLMPPPERVREIASWLPAVPHAPGAPITDRAAWSRLAALPEANVIIRKGEGLLKAPVPDLPDDLYLECSRNGTRRNYERPYQQRIGQLENLVLAECLENRGRFLPALRSRMAAIAAERSWTMPAHDLGLSNFNGKKLFIDLGSSYRAWVLAFSLDWLADRIPAELRARVIAEIRRRVLNVYLAAIRSNDPNGNWWMRGDNNWNAVCHAGVIGTALALVTNREERAQFVASMEIDNRSFLAGFTSDGYCSEGMGYWNYGFGREMMMGLTLRAATQGKFNLFAGEKIKRIAAYALAYQIQPGHSPFFADGGGAPSLDNWALMRQIWPDLVPDRVAGLPLLTGNLNVIALRAFGQEPAPIAAAKPETLPVRSWFPDAQVLICRPEPSASRPFGLALKGGHNNEHHNHNDVGSYTVMLNGIEMAGDPGGEVYTRRTFSKERYVSKVLNSYGHPVPVVAGQLQGTGKSFAAKVLRTSFTPARDEIELDLTAAYPAKSLVSLQRRFSYDRRARVMTIRDEVHFSEPQPFSDPIITYADFRAGSTPGTFTLSRAKQCVNVSVAATGSPFSLRQEKIENPGRPTPLRVAATLERPVNAAVLTFTFAVPNGNSTN